MKPTKDVRKSDSPTSTLALKTLDNEDLRAVSGGSRRGGDPLKYMEVKLKEVLISGV